MTKAKQEITKLVEKYHVVKAQQIDALSDQIRDELIGQGIRINKDGWEIARWRGLALESSIGAKLLDLRGCLEGEPIEKLAPALWEKKA